MAALDLELVRLVRAAMATGRGGAGGGMIHPAPVIEPRRRVEPEPQIEPRPHVRPEPVFEPRMKLRAGAGGLECCGGRVPAAPTEPVEKSSHSPSPIQPPWKVLPWMDLRDATPPRPVRKIKVIEARPDIHCKGAVIDLFI